MGGFAAVWGAKLGECVCGDLNLIPRSARKTGGFGLKNQTNSPAPGQGRDQAGTKLPQAAALKTARGGLGLARDRIQNAQGPAHPPGGFAPAGGVDLF